MSFLFARRSAQKFHFTFDILLVNQDPGCPNKMPVGSTWQVQLKRKTKKSRSMLHVVEKDGNIIFDEKIDFSCTLYKKDYDGEDEFQEKEYQIQLRNDEQRVVYEKRFNISQCLADEPLTEIFALKLKRHPSNLLIPPETYLKIIINSNFDSFHDNRSVTSSQFSRDSSLGSSFCVDSDSTYSVVTPDSFSDSMAVTPILQNFGPDFQEQPPTRDSTRVREMSSPPFVTPPPEAKRRTHVRKSSNGKRMHSPLMFFNPPQDSPLFESPELDSPVDSAVSVSVAGPPKLSKKKLKPPCEKPCEADTHVLPAESNFSLDSGQEEEESSVCGRDMPTVSRSSVELLNDLLVRNVHQTAYDDRFYQSSIPMHACVLFRVFDHWQAFSGERRWILSLFISTLRQIIQRHSKNPEECFFWMQSSALLHLFCRQFETEEDGVKEGIEWFAKRVHQICGRMLDRIVEIFMEKLSHIDWAHLYREDNDTESHTIDSIMVMLRIAVSMAESSQCHSYFKMQFLQRLVSHVVEKLFNECMSRPCTCSVRTGFKLKIAATTIFEWANETFTTEESSMILVSLPFLNALSLALLLIPTASDWDSLRKQFDLNPAQLLYIASHYNCEPNEFINKTLLNQLRELNEDDSKAHLLDLQDEMWKLDLSQVTYSKIDLSLVDGPIQLSDYNAFCFLKDS